MRRRWSVPVIVVLIVGLLLAGLPLRERLLEARRRTGAQAVELAKLPPLGAAGLLLLGGFRAVAVDILWFRVTSLHEERKYEQERSLIELIPRLQPFYTAVWSWLGFHITYNISVQYPDPAIQWQWVKDGIEFLKEGLKLNPGSGGLYFDLAWMHRDKVSQNPYFEEAMEREMGVNNLEQAALYFKRARSICFYVAIRRDWEWSRGPHFAAQIMEDLGVQSLEEVVKSFEGARELKPVETFHASVIDRGVFHAYLARVKQILGRSELTGDLSFTPQALRKAKTFIEECRSESAGLSKRWPTDAASDMFPARIDSVYADGYLRQVDKVLREGSCSGESIDRARKVLDKALAELAKYRPRYKPTRSEQVIRNKTGDAYARIPWALWRRAGEVLSRPFAGPREWRRARELLRVAGEELKRVPPDAGEYRDLQVLNQMVPQGLKSLEERIEKHGKPTPTKVAKALGID